MKRFLLLLAGLSLAACVDTTGLTAVIHTDPHPQSNENAAVTVSEFADLQCPACRAAHTLIMQPLLEQAGGRIRYEFRHFPLSSIHRMALPAAEAAECAADQGKFWEYVDLVYANQDNLNDGSLAAWGEELSLDIELFGRCRKSHIKRDAILASYEEGKDAGVGGTPTFFVNGTRVETDLATILEAINATSGAIEQRL